MHLFNRPTTLFRRDKADHYLLLRKMRYWLKTGGEESGVDDMQVNE